MGSGTKPEDTGGSVVSMLTVCYKWLINKCMSDYCVSASKHPLQIQRTPPLRYMGVFVSHIGRYLKGFFCLHVFQYLYSLNSGFILSFALTGGYGEREGLLTFPCLQVREPYHAISAFKVVMGSARGLGSILSSLSLPGPPGGSCHA